MSLQGGAYLRFCRPQPETRNHRYGIASVLIYVPAFAIIHYAYPQMDGQAKLTG